MSYLAFSIPVLLIAYTDQQPDLAKEPKQVPLTINNPADIECYHPAYDGGSTIIMRSGATFFSEIEAAKITQHIAGFYEELGKRAQMEAVKPQILVPAGGQQ